jgi:hypothetical protein
VPEASVLHDFSDISTVGLLRKQRIYAEGGYVVWRRRGTTYEATPGRVAPYLLGPFLLLLGALMLIPAPLRTWGLWVLATGALVLAALALGLTVQGLAEDSTYPGLRYRILEIPRRWATLYGAFRGLLHYGLRGRAPPTGKA